MIILWCLIISVENVYADVSVNNMSNHIPLSVQFKITMKHTTIESVTSDEKLLWASANQSDIANYRLNLISYFIIIIYHLSCHDHFCEEHNIDLQMFHDVVAIGACLTASKCMPSSKVLIIILIDPV